MVTDLIVSLRVFEQVIRYRTLGDFLRVRPKYIWLAEAAGEVLESGRERFQAAQSESLWFGLSEEGRRMVAAAVAIVVPLGIAGEEVVFPLRGLVEAWERGRRFDR